MAEPGGDDDRTVCSEVHPRCSGYSLLLPADTKTGVIPIGSIDWNAIRAEYIGGGTSYRKLAKKYGVSINVLSPRATVEGWVGMRKEAETKATAKALQKTADIAADASFDDATVPYSIGTLLQRIVTAVKVHISKVSTKTSKIPKSPWF